MQTNNPIQDLRVLILDLNRRDGTTVFPFTFIITHLELLYKFYTESYIDNLKNHYNFLIKTPLDKYQDFQEKNQQCLSNYNLD
ncbi:hypothetical protein [Planktothrix sp.]|uniref:hypothetical protein n=1 Tax=Planktothrix sp. TaxID=3088171 RepID=UPI0038D42806